MIVYNNTKKNFLDDVRDNVIADNILRQIRLHGIYAGQEKEYRSWQNSMQFMGYAIDDAKIDDDVQIAIEYNIPLTSKRVDFIISGSDENNNDNVVIVEIKQWEKAEIVADDMHYSVRTFVANDNRIVCHPSYQAYSYSRFIYNYAQSVTDCNIQLKPCAYLHNYLKEYKNVLSDSIYNDWTKEAPFFIKSERKEFSECRFLSKVTHQSYHTDPAFS